MILSIESSCDDSSIAITEIKTNKLIYHKKISQELQHSIYGGVVPELAARLHVEALPKILEECKEYFPLLKAIAVTNAPGLSVTLMEGVTMAKALSISLNLPLIAVNHLKGHIYSLFIEKQEVLPITILLVSGGHTQIIEANSLNEMKVVATTIDDSFGESFDKVSKMLGLGYPGGPIIDKMYYKGNRNYLKITKPKVSKYDFSFSGIKTAIINFDNKMKMKNEEYKKEDLAASFLGTVVDILCEKTLAAAIEKNVKTIMLAGGVAANSLLRSQLTEMAKKIGIKVIYPSMKLCTDNAAMIAEAAFYKLKNSKNEKDCFADLDLNGIASLNVSNE